MPQTLSIKKQHLKAGASYVKQVHCINFLVICHKGAKYAPLKIPDQLGIFICFFVLIRQNRILIFPIGEKVIIKAFHFLNKLKEHGYNDLHVSINISVTQLLNPDFASRLFELISDMQIDPENIDIEITESVFAHDYDIINIILLLVGKKN